MIRFLARVLGFLLVAAGFVGLVVDGTRSIANGAVSFTPLGEVARLFPGIEPFVTRHLHPVLWDPVFLNLFLLPASLLAVALGALLLWLGRRPAELIGHLAGR